jgi:small subunit ribosomal protein S6
VVANPANSAAQRTYELVFIADPRLTDEQVVGLTDDYKSMITGAGGKVVREESWGKRKLAYPISKLTEGQYVVLYVETPIGVNPFPEVEQRLRQNEKILRYLTVRTDLDLKRAARKGKVKKPRTGAAAEVRS